jgi:hypothetical protein
MQNRTRVHNFTLLEIVICIAILGTASVTLAWQMLGMLRTYNFDRGVEQFFTDLRKGQLVALADRVDIEVWIEKKDNVFFYRLRSDSILPSFNKKSHRIQGLAKMQLDGKEKEQLKLTIFSSGRIEGVEQLQFVHDKSRAFTFDFRNPLILRMGRG